MNKQEWIKVALDAGFENFEIYQNLEENKTLTWYDGQLDTFVTSRVLGTALRGVYQGKMANMAMEYDDDNAMATVISAMKEQAVAITSDDIEQLRAPQESEKPVAPKHWIPADNRNVQTILKQLEEKILAYDERIAQVTALEYEESANRREITNSLGLHVDEASRVQILVAGAAAMENGDIKNDYLVEPVENLAEYDLDSFVKKLCDTVLNKLNAVSLPSGNYPVIMEKEAMTSLFAALSGMFSGDLIYKGISPLKDKVDEEIFSDLITVVDDPRNTEALVPVNYDDEGCPTRKKVIVDKGVFKTILHSTKTAARMHTESTGNGFKPGYAGSVGVEPMNCCIMPGEKPLEELCAMMNEGLVITDLAGLHAGIDHVTTDFSLQCSGYYVKDGVRDHSVTLITVAGNFLDMMKHVTEVGSDLDWKYHTIASPSILFESLAISGE